MSTRLLVADAQEVMREGLKSQLARTKISVVAEAKNPRELFRLLPKSRVNVVLLDVNLGDGEGFEALKRLRKKWPDLPVLMWSSTDNPTYVARSNALGANGFLPRGSDRQETISALKTVASDRYYWTPEHFEMVVEELERPEDLDAPLTPREFDVLRQLAFGLSNKEIALALEISYETVKGHIQHILRKLDAKDRTEAAVLFVRRGYI